GSDICYTTWSRHPSRSCDASRPVLVVRPRLTRKPPSVLYPARNLRERKRTVKVAALGATPDAVRSVRALCPVERRVCRCFPRFGRGTHLARVEADSRQHGGPMTTQATAGPVAGSPEPATRLRCESCQQPVSSEQKFCGACGATLIALTARCERKYA